MKPSRVNNSPALPHFLPPDLIIVFLHLHTFSRHAQATVILTWGIPWWTTAPSRPRGKLLFPHFWSGTRREIVRTENKRAGYGLQ